MINLSRILLGLAIGVALILSGAFVASPMAYMIQWLDGIIAINPYIYKILGHVLWFFPLSSIITTLSTWITVYVSTITIFALMKVSSLC